MHRKFGRLVLVVVALGVIAALVVAGRTFARSGGTPAAAETASPTAVPTSGPTPLPSPTATTTTSPRSSGTSGSVAPPPASASASTGGGTAVDVVLGYADWDDAGAQVEAAGFAAVVQSGGTCTLVLTSGSQRVQASAAGEPDASTTNCGRLTVPADQLTPGPWTVTLSYRSKQSVGTSQAVTVAVPSR